MARLSGARYGRAAVWLAAGAYFLVPLACAVAFSVEDPRKGVDFEAYTGMFGADGFTGSLVLTVKVGAATVALVLVLLLPALITVRLTAPRLRTLVELVCLLPLVVPAMALVAGISAVLRWGPDHFAGTPLFDAFVGLQNPDFPGVLVLAYTLMALPLAYRTLDAGLAAIDLRVLVEAARACRASWPRTLVHVVLPNLRGALLNTAFLTLALVFGEYTVAAILGYQPFAVWIVVISGSQAQMSVAASMIGLLVTWVLLLVLAATGRARRTKETS
ncbi:ABC transporter permease subunit [Microtetraspora sp. NBRC 16547]|uniref:ABC transporter permease n=1 Tax=Microtetraspora sp. NBRC 16547 TaxID=3030993 RepID=UPI0024A43869|nr:ABC transporter permease subunit [Microtetraspora sp. NBRC 16547]GLW99064.1 spermidine/putrescine ABC transporter permease [Microtetraspora sp. NBRC 16547]